MLTDEYIVFPSLNEKGQGRPGALRSQDALALAMDSLYHGGGKTVNGGTDKILGGIAKKFL